MARRLLQINFNLKVSRGDYEAEARDVAQMFADVPGLVWKVWLMNDERNGAGGIYLFESEQALNHYVGGPLLKRYAQIQPSITLVSSLLKS